ncbi:MAG: tripartite tricarboxylate transporter substrate binding protein [Betaproteobacteria bacterium]
MRRRTLIQSAAAAVVAPAAVWAQDRYPARLITWICPYAAGGNADTRSRQISRLMAKELGQQIIVDNKAGAGGNIGTDAISKARPDGYTIGMGNFAPLAVNQALFRRLPFDPSDLVPILLLERGPLVLMVRSDSPYQSVKDLAAAAKAKPGKLSYASGGIGGSHHLSGALLEAAAGIDMIHAPYKSGAAGATDLMGGQVDCMFEQMYAAMPSIKGGRLRPLAITSRVRSPLLPNLPTMAESGFPAVEVQNWQGIVGPKGLPAEIVDTLNRAGNKALQDKEQRDLMLGQGNEIGGGTPQEFAALIASERPRWARVVRDAKIEPE